MKTLTILLAALLSTTMFGQGLPENPRPRVSRLTKVSIALSFAGTIADVETTSAALRNPVCREVNPVLGSHPSRAKLYAVTLPVTGTFALLSIWLSHRGSRIAWVSPLIIGAAHGAAAIHNSTTGCF